MKVLKSRFISEAGERASGKLKTGIIPSPSVIIKRARRGRDTRLLKTDKRRREPAGVLSP